MAAKKKSIKKSKVAAKRQLIAPRGDKRYVRRDAKGRIKESADQGRSLASDRRRKAKTTSKRGQGDKGDRETSRSARKGVSVPNNEAIAQLTADHARVKKMFRQYEQLARAQAGDSQREDLAARICAELTAHATAEEEIFYPAARAALDEADLINEAEIEHMSAKDLIAQIGSTSLSNAKFDALVKVLGEYINHHVQEEEGEIFPKVRRAKLDTAELGEKIAARKAKLLTKMVQ